MSKLMARDVPEDPDFKALLSQKRSISTVLTVLELVLFFGFIALVAWEKDFLALRIGGSATTIGIPIAVGVIVASWILTGIYVHWANNTYDVLVRKVRGRIGA